MVSLNEEIYKIKEFEKVDSDFQYLLDNYKDPSSFNRPDFKKKLNSIIQIMNKAFDLDAKLFFDLTNKSYVSYGMAIYPSYEEFKGNLFDAIKTKKGFKLLACHNVSIEIDSAFFDKLARSDNINGKHLTAVLLHEIGHKIFWKSQHGIYYNAQNENKNYLYSIIANILAVISAATVVLIPVACILFYISFSFGICGDTQTYSRAEGLSDDTAIYYGYGREKYEILKWLQDECNVKFKKSKFKLINYLRKNSNYYYLRRKNVMDIIEEEMNNADSPTMKNELRKIFQDVKKSQEEDFLGESLLIGDDNTFLTLEEYSNHLNELDKIYDI